ncbi:MAG TPA: hypothetical protein VD738_03085 [Nitrospira sp.]|jgi:hypothetical protein|nr:hypothetical protein [Nitrospira sp.]
MRERIVTLLVIGLVLVYALWTLRSQPSSSSPRIVESSGLAPSLSPDMIPLATGEEPLIDIFTRAGCPVCHTIPGIPGANGQVGPRLNLGRTGPERIRNPAYRGEAKTIHDYVVESVLEPARFEVPGYPERTMPEWYGSKLSALALEKIATYLEQQTD